VSVAAAALVLSPLLAVVATNRAPMAGLRCSGKSGVGRERAVRAPVSQHVRAPNVRRSRQRDRDADCAAIRRLSIDELPQT
jgi:hypothetical protein